MASLAKTKPKPADITPEEQARRNACLDQYWRVRDYQPVLERRVAALERELEETRAHLKAEYRAADDLLWESTVTPEQIAARDRERAAAA